MLAGVQWCSNVAGEDLNNTMKRECLTIKEAVTFDRLEEFILQEQARGIELTSGSDFERALALMTLRRFRVKRASRSQPTASEGSDLEVSGTKAQSAI
jgi:hypothetical protein